MRYHEAGRIRYILEAIDSDDTDLLWSDRKKWLSNHGYGGQFKHQGKTIYIPLREV